MILIRAERFTPNPATAADNMFQAEAPEGQSDDTTSALALAEMDTLAEVLRNVGVALGYSLLAYDSCLRGLGKLEADPERLARDLDDNWEVLAEPIQTVMRRYGVQGAYEKLKEVTRGKTVQAADLHNLIRGLEIPESEKERLLAMTPGSYVGKAAELARRA